MKYGNDFNKRNREIQLDGEAYFEVARDTLRPFVVKSQKLAIKVLGTRFNVKAYHAGEVVLSPDRMDAELQ